MNNFPIDDITPEFHKAWHYANSFMASAIKTEEHCGIFLDSLTGWTPEEKEFLLWAWILIDTGQDTIVRDEVIYTCYEDEDEIETSEEIKD